MSWQDWVAVALAAAAAVYLGKSLLSGDDEEGGCDACPKPPAGVKSPEGEENSHERKREVH